MLTIDKLPNIKFTANGNYRQSQPFTKDNVLAVMADLGITARFDMAAAGVVLLQHGAVLDPGVGYNLIADALTLLDINNIGRLDEVLKELAALDRFHPMEDWLNSLEWDGVSRIDDLAATIETDNDLWPIYLCKWLIQTVEGVCGWRDTQERSLPHVLVLVGGQGLGKSHWLGRLGGAWFKGEAELHLSSPSGKDHQLEVLKYPMAELAELDGIFRKADVSHMKAFISRGVDAIRAPYERRPIIRPRMTSFCASVNEAEFLNDTTGSRRFWPVQVDKIAWSFEMDWAQLWAEAFELWLSGADFALTAEEDRLRAGTAIKSHTLVTDEEETLREFYRRHHGHKSFPDAAMNRTEILRMLFGEGRIFSNKQVSDTGKILADILGKHKTIDGKQRAWMFPFNEFATDRSTWPDKNHLQSV